MCHDTAEYQHLVTQVLYFTSVADIFVISYTSSLTVYLRNFIALLAESGTPFIAGCYAGYTVL